MLRGLCPNTREEDKTKNRPIGRFLVLWLPFLDLNQRPPMITPTSAYAEVEKFRLSLLWVAFAKANRKTFVRATFSCLPVTWWEYLVKLKRSGKMKSRGYCLGFPFCGSPFWTWTKDPLWLPLHPLKRMWKVWLVCPLRTHIFLRKPQNFCQSNLRLPACYLMRVFGLNPNKRSKTKTESFWTPSSFCGSPFWTWTKDPLINSQVL